MSCFPDQILFFMIVLIIHYELSMNVMLLMMLLVSNVVRRMIDCLFVFNSNNRGVCVCVSASVRFGRASEETFGGHLF